MTATCRLRSKRVCEFRIRAWEVPAAKLRVLPSSIDILLFLSMTLLGITRVASTVNLIRNVFHGESLKM